MAELEVTAGAENGANGATDGGNGEGHETTTGTQNTGKTYTEAEIQSMLDKRVNQALETAKGKWEKDYTARLEAEKQKAAERAAMSAEERARAEFEDRVREITERENAYRHEKAVFDTVKILSEKGLPAELAEALTGADAEETNKKIEAFSEKFNAAVEKAVKDKLFSASKSPKTGSTAQPVSGVEAAFYNMNPKLRR